MSEQDSLDDVLPLSKEQLALSQDQLALSNDQLAFLEHILISNIRLYDVMLTLLDEIAGNEAGNKLRAMHMRGEYFYPPVDVYEEPEEG